MSIENFLINPFSHEVSAKYIEDNGRKQVQILDPLLMQGLASVGIAVPGGFANANGKCYIFPSDDRDLFARAFTEEYFRHGLMQQGYYWVKREDYTGPEGEIQKALSCVLRALRGE